MPKSPRIFITGLANSGTTWATNLLAACGLDAGTAKSGLRHGMEWQPLRTLAVELHDFLGGTERHAEVIREYAGRIAALDCPELVKLPWVASLDVILQTLTPQFVVVVTRPLKSRARRIWAAEPWLRGLGFDEVVAQCATEFGYCMDVVEISEIPYAMLRYPRGAYQPEYAYQCVGELCGVSWERFRAAHQEVTRMDWVDYAATTFQGNTPEA
ncbi:MAG: hypothetical protein Q8R28_07880 [Dehalococcoidia bacterium]|nr:hypothetical protein [Dehalococcoidia bacterium]